MLNLAIRCLDRKAEGPSKSLDHTCKKGPVRFVRRFAQRPVDILKGRDYFFVR
jgi:hypothetical protein